MHMKKLLGVAFEVAIGLAALTAVYIGVVRGDEPGSLTVAKADWAKLTDSRLSMGLTTAPVTVVEFLDYQCPVCERFEAVLSDLEREHPGKIRRIVRHFPIASLHPQAEVAATAASCAAEQNAFESMHDVLIRNQSSFSEIAFDTLGRATDVPDPQGFAACVSSGRYFARVNAERDLCGAFGVTGTPTFIVNRKWLSGLSPASLRATLKRDLD
jgi:protein-disulfide isomerase